MLLERARNEAGIELTIISAAEEARLAAIGCAPLIDPQADGALIFDIGGGSTEVIWMRRDHDGAPYVESSASEPAGVVTLVGRVGRPRDRSRRLWSDARRDDRALPSHAAREMDKIAPFDPVTHHLLGTSGTVTTLAGIALGLRATIATGSTQAGIVAPTSWPL